MAELDTTILVYITAPNLETAESIARSILEKRLAAGANIIPAIKSIYHWKGEIESADESILILKTRSELYSELQAHVLSVHPYETPCIVALHSSDANPAFAAWIINETTQPDAAPES